MNNKQWGKGLGIEVYYFKANSFMARPSRGCDGLKMGGLAR